MSGVPTPRRRTFAAGILPILLGAERAAGFATMLAWRYPHGTGVFATFAAPAGAQRVFASAHYPSDVCFGAALGLAGAALVSFRSRGGIGIGQPEAGVAVEPNLGFGSNRQRRQGP
jgi:membrane-associated phospholipid phosphatase